MLSEETVRALVYMYIATAGFRHDSTPTAVQALRSRGSVVNVDFQNTEDKGVFTDQDLEGCPSRHFLERHRRRSRFKQNYLNNGGNFVGIPSASDTLNTTAFYGKELGAYFDYHPELRLDAVWPDASHPSTEKLPTDWPFRDEIQGTISNQIPGLHTNRHAHSNGSAYPQRLQPVSTLSETSSHDCLFDDIANHDNYRVS
ncbi:hypothetical protein F5146DRAFT_1120095 [Armillaria mellea]|nr:hypothetical protein F5146DRAFT_1120095 [Armillaria mellea]